MEATVLSVGKSVLDGALSYAQSAIAEEVALQLGVRRDQVFITNELEMMQAFLMAAHDEGDDNKVVKVWVKQVRDVAYDVEDCLLDFAVRLEKQSWWRIPRTLLDRRHVAKQMKELRANVEDVSQRNTRYHLIKGSGSKATSVGGQSAIAGATMSGIDEARRQRENAKLDLIRLINNKDDDLRVIAVWGKSSGDVAEMSIIKRAYEDGKIHKKFECRAWIGLMRPYKSTEFMQNIVGQFYINSLQEEGEEAATGAQVLKMMGMAKEQDLADEFKRYLIENSYLIFLNDIQTIEEWDLIKTLFPNNKRGSRIIVSTEQLRVATLCAGAENGAPGHKQLFDDQTLYAFYNKGSQDGTGSSEAGSSSTAAPTGANKSMLNRTETMLAAYKASHLVGRVKEKSDIINLITSEDNQQLEVISVWGMGGLGKTTLVKDVYQSQELSGKFEKRACVTIMRPFNRYELLKNLAKQFEYSGDVEAMATYLEGRKYLIVFDDLSSTTEWDALIPYFPSMETSSRIIVTTRIMNIAKHCSKKHEKIYELQSLGHDVARDLFMEKVFDKTTDLDEQYPELVEQANLILKKCKGLPLAIVTIGGFLANQPKIALEWRKLNEHISAELQMNPELETIITVLNKSYDGLPYHLKSCFLYLSIFPEDHEIRLKRLLWRWTAEGYSSVVRNKSAEEVAESYFMELICRSMLLPFQQSIYSRRGIDGCRVHDLIREIGMSKSMEEDLVFRLEKGCSLSTQGTTRHLAIYSNWEADESEFESMVDMSRVRSITVFGDWKPFFISDKMRLLRVLDLEDTTGLVDHHLEHIGKLLHLRYLSLRGCRDIFHLPDSLGNLRQLQTLDIRGTSIVMLPKTISKLRKLQHLRAGRKTSFSIKQIDSSARYPLLAMGPKLCAACCVPRVMKIEGFNRRDACTFACCAAIPCIMRDLNHGGVMVPRGTRKLKALRTLGNVDLASGDAVLQEIKTLTGLRKLRVIGVNKKNGPEFCSVISNLSLLESLSVLSHGPCLDTFSPPSSLQSATLVMDKFPRWINKLENLVKLTMAFETSDQSERDAAMQVLGNLPNLSILRQYGLFVKERNLFGGEELCFQSESFRSLVVLQVDDLGESIKSVKIEQGALPKLEHLQVVCRYRRNEIGFSGLDLLPSIKQVWLANVTDQLMEQFQTQLALNPNKSIFKLGFIKV